MSFLDQTMDGVHDAADKHVSNIRHDLHHIRASVDALIKRDEMFRFAGNGTSTAGAAVQVPLVDPVGPGFAWEMQRVSTMCINPATGAVAASGACDLYLDTVDPSNLVEVIANATKYADAFQNNIFVPEYRQVVANFTGLPAAPIQCVIAIQVRVFAHPPPINISREEFGWAGA